MINKILLNLYNSNKELENRGFTFSYSPILMGETGIGKTSMVREFCKSINQECVVLRLSQLDEIGHLLGNPVTSYLVSRNSENIEIESIHLERFLETGYSVVKGPYMTYIPPFWVSQLKEGDILFIDDFGRQMSLFNNAVMDIIYERGNISWKLPKHCMVILSGNPGNGEYQVQEADSAQKRRMIEIPIEFNLKSWSEWAKSVNIENKYIKFIKENTSLVAGWKVSKKETNSLPIAKWSEIFIFLSINKDAEISDLRSTLKFMIGNTDLTTLLLDYVTKRIVLFDVDILLNVKKPLVDIIKEYEEFILDNSDTPKEEIINNTSFKLINELENKYKSNDRDGIKELNTRLYEILKSSIIGEDIKDSITKTILSNTNSDDDAVLDTLTEHMIRV